MNIEELRDYCLQKPGAAESFPFGEDTLVFKTGDKMFLLCSLADGRHFNAKCDPELAVALRERHNEVKPGYHMNKASWNTVYMGGTLTRKQLHEMIDHSYTLIFKNLPKKVQAAITAGA